MIQFATFNNGLGPLKTKSVGIMSLALISIIFIVKSFAVSVSAFTKGEQMIPVLNRLGVHAACFGNHDFGG